MTVVEIKIPRPSSKHIDSGYEIWHDNTRSQEVLHREAQKYERALAKFYRIMGEEVRVEDIVVLSKGIIAHKEQPELQRNLEDFLGCINESIYTSHFDITLIYRMNNTRRVMDYRVVMPVQQTVTSLTTPTQYSLQDKNAVYIIALEVHRRSNENGEKIKEKTPFRIPLSYILGGEKTKKGRPVHAIEVRDPMTCTILFKQPRTRVQTVTQCRKREPR